MSRVAALDTDRDRLVREVADAVRELTQPYRREVKSYRWSKSRNRVWTSWTTQFPSLLDQMHDAAAYDRRGQLGGGGRHIRPGSAVSAVLVALEGIRVSVHGWVVELGGAPGGLAADLRLLVALAPIVDHRTLVRLAADVARWHRIAETCSGW